MSRYIVIRIHPSFSTAVQVGEDFTVNDEPAAYQLALSKALDAMSAIRESIRKDDQRHVEELADYNRAGSPLTEVVLDHDRMIRRVLADLNHAFTRHHHPTYAVVELLAGVVPAA